MIDHLVVKLVLLSLSCQMYFDSSVPLESSLWVNVDLSVSLFKSSFCESDVVLGSSLISCSRCFLCIVDQAGG